jgi:hypothetical protein
MKEQILNEIAEKVMVNLAKHNVELGVVDDLKSAAIKMEKMYADLQNNSAKYKKLKKDAEDYYEVLKKSFYSLKPFVQNDMRKLLDEVQTKAKELGIAPISDIPEYKGIINKRTEVLDDITGREKGYLWGK